MFLGRGITVFISGEAGCGKTRLTKEFLEIAKKREITVLTGWCLSNATVPYFPFIEAFDIQSPFIKEENSLAIAQELSVKSWITETNNIPYGGSKDNAASQLWKDQTFAAITEELLIMSAKKPTILFLEDVHWADSASLSLLHYISRSISAERVLVVATFRSEELTEPFDGRPNPLIETLRLMGREDLFREIKLPNLNQASVEKIAENMLEGRIDIELTKRIAEESRGNPLFIVESLRMLADHCDLTLKHGVWHLSVDKINIPTKVKEIILRRISKLKLEQRRVLEVASVIGEIFDAEQVGRVLQQERLEVLETLDAINHSSLLVYPEENNFRFDHSRSREIIYDEIPSPLRKEYHSKIAEGLEQKKSKVSSAGDLAHHFAQAGRKEKAVEYALIAGKDALAKFSTLEAISHFNYVLQSNSKDLSFSNMQVALEGMGDAYIAKGLFEEAIKTLEKFNQNEKGFLSLRILRKLMSAYFLVGGPKRSYALELSKKALKFESPDRLEFARVKVWEGKATGWGGNVNKAIECLEEALQIFEEEYSLLDLASVLFELGHMYAVNGQLEKALVCRTIFGCNL